MVDKLGESRVDRLGEEGLVQFLNEKTAELKGLKEFASVGEVEGHGGERLKAES